MGIDDLKQGPALAFYYEREGLRIMPLVSGAKGSPRFAGFGRENPDFTINPSDFRDSDAVAILCGPEPIWGGPDGEWWLMCVDIDGEPPDESWELREFGQNLPPTLTSKDGAHRWYRVPRYRRDEIGQWTRLIEWSGGGVDLKWAGGYAVERGQWDGRFGLERIAELPKDLVDRVIALGTDAGELESLVDVLAALARVWARPKARGGDGGCHAAALALGGILARAGVAAEEAEQGILDADFWTRTGTDDRTADVLASIEAHGANRNTYGWPQFEQVSPAKERALARVRRRVERFLGRRRAALVPLVPASEEPAGDWGAPREGDYIYISGKVHARVEALQAILVARAGRGESNVYRAGEVLARVITDRFDPLAADQLAEEISKGPERCWRPKKKQGATTYTPMDPPGPECSLLARKKVWPGIPELRGVATCPFLREDGTICEQQGYDAKSRWYLAEGSLELPLPVPAAPSSGELEKARALLRAPWCDFKWESPAAALVGPSAVLSVLAQAAINNRVPMHAFDAPTLEVGKSLAANLVGIVATGNDLDPVTWPSAEEERGKYLATMAGKNPIFFIDNQERARMFASSSLERTLTSGGVRYRLLGTNEERTAPWASVVLLTGNGLNFSEETGRRTLKATITGRNEELEESGDWTIPDVETWCGLNRGWLVWAGLTVLRGHAAAGVPAGKPLGSFPLWSRVVADALEWAYGARVIECKARADSDESLVLFDALLSALVGCVGHDTVWGWEEILAATGPASLGDPAAVALKSAVIAVTESVLKRAKALPASIAERDGNDPNVLNAVTWGLLLAKIGRFGDRRPYGTLRKIHTKSRNGFLIERAK